MYFQIISSTYYRELASFRLYKFLGLTPKCPREGGAWLENYLEMAK